MVIETADAAAAALAAWDAGLCVVPPREDGTKRPEGNWRSYQRVRPSREQVEAWYALGRRGVGVVCGHVSGGLEMMEFEGRAVDEKVNRAFLDTAEAAGYGELIERITGGYLEWTPGGGLHLLYRCTEVTGNTKLARRPATADELLENPEERFKVLIETRGEGGFVITAPSGGGVHPTGGAWELIQGGFDRIATITPEERADLFALARAFDRVEDETTSVPPPNTAAALLEQVDGDRPGDIYNARTSWHDVLGPHGWLLVSEKAGVGYWRRPGKTHGISATTNALGTDRLIVFSSSTPFDSDSHGGRMTSYDRFGAYAVLEHRGDRTEAARALRRLGYGGTTAHDDLGWVATTSGNATASTTVGTVAAPATTNGVPPAVARHAGTHVDWAKFWDADTTDSDWLAEPFIARGRGHALYAPAKTGKSLLTLAVCAALATGRPVLNQPAGPPMSVVYFDLEMTEDDLRDRLEDLGYGPEVDMTNLHYYVLPSLPALDTPAGGADVVELARYHDAALVVIETTARATSGPENDADTLRAFYAHTGRQLKAEGRAMLRTDHAGKDLERGQRGSSAKSDDVDVVWKLTARDGGHFTLAATHRRMRWVPQTIDLHQQSDPLRYTTVGGSWPAGTAELAERLDLFGVPLDASRREAHRILKERDGKAAKAEILGKALQFRQTPEYGLEHASEWLGTTPGTTPAAVPGTTPGNHLPKTTPDQEGTSAGTSGNQ